MEGKMFKKVLVSSDSTEYKKNVDKFTAHLPLNPVKVSTHFQSLTYIFTPGLRSKLTNVSKVTVKIFGMIM